jgi:2-polyprenyl-6-methoxyphenol hydroxylase-like FAD-dependent oxidoreductase
MTEKVLVIGAGMAGLCCALTLASPSRESGDREIVILEKDAPPPEGGTDQAFFDWNRRGVGQLRHSHAFLARLRTIIKRRHPELLARLLEAGCREISFADMLPDGLKADYVAEEGDSEMAVLTSRRTTLEWVMRRYVETLPGVSIVSEAVVLGLLTEKGANGQIKVLGAQGELKGEATEWRAGFTVDGAGRNSQAADQLREAGAMIAETAEDCGILYYTRHYRLLPGVGEPSRTRGAGTGDMGFIKYGLFPGDNGCFSITLAVPEVEMEIRQHVVRPETFDAICAEYPGIAGWTDPATSEPISKVFGMGDLRSRWRAFVAEDQPAILGFFAVGDSLVRTNPLYGRGCSFAAVEADILAAVLEHTADPAARARLYDTRVREELTPYFNSMRDQDRGAIRRARNILTPGYEPKLRAKVMTSFLEDGIRIAMRSEIDLLRAALRDFHMLEPPGKWLRKPQNAAKVIKWWARGKRRNADLYPPPVGPGRSELMAKIGLDAAADIVRVQAAA